MDENKISAGINIDEDSKRYYPYNNLGAHVIGFTGTDEQGLYRSRAKSEWDFSRFKWKNNNNWKCKRKRDFFRLRTIHRSRKWFRPIFNDRRKHTKSS